MTRDCGLKWIGRTKTVNEMPEKSVFELPKMVTDNPQGNFETMLNLIYGKDGWSYIRYGEKDMPLRISA